MSHDPTQTAFTPTSSIDSKRREYLKAQMLLALASTGVLSSPLSFAADAPKSTYPNRPIKMIVPWPPGQATDLAARVLSQEMSKIIGTQIIIDNKAGAGGGIGTDAATCGWVHHFGGIKRPRHGEPFAAKNPL